MAGIFLYDCKGNLIHRKWNIIHDLSDNRKVCNTLLSQSEVSSFSHSQPDESHWVTGEVETLGTLPLKPEADTTAGIYIPLLAI